MKIITRSALLATAAILLLASLPRTSSGIAFPTGVGIKFQEKYKEAVINWDQIPGATGYRIFRSLNEGGDYREIGTVVGSQTWYNDKGVEWGKTYYYVLQTLSGSRPSPRSLATKVTIPPESVLDEVTPPAWKFVHVRGRSQDGRARYVVWLFWENAKRAAAYNVYRSEKKDRDYRLITSIPDPEARYVDEDISPGKTYYYKVTSLNRKFAETALADSAARSAYIPREGEKAAEGELSGMEFSEFYDHNRVPFGGRAGFGFKDPHKGMRNLQPCGRCHEGPKAEEPASVTMMKAPGEDRKAESEFYAAPDRKMLLKEKAVPGLEYGRGRPASQMPPGPTYEGFGEVFDEVWVIEKAEVLLPVPDEGYPGSGELQAIIPGEEKEIPLPLKHTAVKADIAGYVASVRVTQAYENPYDGKIEAVYVFPLPQNAAVTDFVMVIGDRRIRGIIREREEAVRIYETAKRQGYVASLLTQERPNIFTQRVANIEPGKAIDVEILYFNTLAYSEGEYTFVFPMVVGPRYNPPGYTEGVGAVARGSGGISGQKTEVEYLKPGERSGHDIMVTVDLEAGVALEKVYSNSHAIEVDKKGSTSARVKIKPADTIPNKDFVLRYRVAGNKVKTAMMVERKEGQGYFTLMLQPPANLKDLPRTGKEMVFVLDCSGSMSGWPMEKAKAAMRRALKNLSPDDTFQVIRFSNKASALGPAPLPATPKNIEMALAYVDSLHGSGGTQMIEGIKAALDFPHDPRRFRIVSFMTDGYIGNEVQILQEIERRLGASRIFSFGVGNSVNRYLIERMAKAGRGAVAYLLTSDSDTEAVDLFYERIGHPALTDIEIDWGGMEVASVYPKTIPDLFVGRPVIITGKFTGHGETTMRVRGKNSGEPQTMELKVPLDAPEGRHQGISKIWARAKIADLMDAMSATGTDEAKGEVLETALSHNLVSAYTAFVAVDSSRITEGDHGTTVNVPVPVPDGVKYETTIQEQ